MTEFGLSGTIYDAPPAHPEIFKVGAPDLEAQLGSGFQAAHIWVNNRSNQSLYLPDAPDVVPPGVTRVVAIRNTDIARASWTIPPQFAVTQFPAANGAAILIWLHGDIEMSPSPGVANNPNVQSPQKNLGTIVVPANGNNSATYTVPDGTHSIGVLVQTGALSSLKVSGAQSGGPYLSLPPAGVGGASLQGPFISAFFSGADSSVNIFAAAGAIGATILVVAILSAQAQFVFNNVSESTAVSLVGGAGIALGDTSAPALAADTLTETISAPGLVPNNAATLVMASFKPAAGQTIAPVGALGAFTKGTSTAVNPPYGQAPVAGHLLAAIVSGSTTPILCGTAGWVKAISGGSSGDSGGNGQAVAIWYKPNSAGGDAAPQFTGGSAGAPCMFAQLAEFSGVATAAPVDQTGVDNVNGSSTTNTVVNGSIDAQSGDLVMAGSRFAVNNAPAVATYSDTFNNNAVAVAMGNNGNGDVSSCALAGTTRYVNHTYAIVPVIAAALPLGVAPWRYDVDGTSAPATGSQAAVVLAASPGKTYTCHTLIGTLLQTTAVAPLVTLQIQDGAGTVMAVNVGTQAVIGASAIIPLVGIVKAGTKGNSMTGQFSGGSSGTDESIYIGAYLR